MIRPDLIVDILDGYSLPLLGTHGVSHWGRAHETGLKIAGKNGADPAVAEYFAVFHDSRRKGEGDDPGHGRRGAELAEQFRSSLDLWRVGTRPDNGYLCTLHAKEREIQEWASRRSVEDYVLRCSREWLSLFESGGV